MFFSFRPIRATSFTSYTRASTTARIKPGREETSHCRLDFPDFLRSRRKEREMRGKDSVGDEVGTKGRSF